MDEVNILCLGDSLTAGLSQWGLQFTPYADKMREVLKAAWPSTKVNVVVEGMSGDRVVSGFFLARLKAECSRTKKSYDWVIVLGGTNDIAHSTNPDDVFAGLESCYEMAFSHGANVLALTIPECSATLESLNTRRNAVNKLIMEYKEDRFYTLDLHGIVTYHNMSKESRDQIWDDGLHLKPNGYNMMGKHIANRLLELYASTEESQDNEGQPGISET